MSSEINLDLGLGEAVAPQGYKGKPEYAPPYYTINIAFVEHMPEYEVVGVNGEVLQIQRGVDVPNIPNAFIQNLKTCLTGKQVTRKGPDQKEYHEWVQVPAIPFQIVEGPYQKRKEG